MAFVQRYHAEITLHKESVAEHQFFVARSTMAICFELKHYKIAEPDAAKAIGMALIHDEAESVTGDMPGHIKRKYPDLKKALVDAEAEAMFSIYSKMPTAIMDNYLGLLHEYLDKNLLESQIVKYADILDIAAFSQNERKLGNTLLTGPFDTAQEWLVELDWPWLSNLHSRRILTRITP